MDTRYTGAVTSVARVAIVRGGFKNHSHRHEAAFDGTRATTCSNMAAVNENTFANKTLLIMHRTETQWGKALHVSDV